MIVFRVSPFFQAYLSLVSRYRVRFTPLSLWAFFHYGFGLGSLLLGLRPLGLLFLGFRGPFTPFRDRAFSFSGFGLGLLRLKLRPGCTPLFFHSGFGRGLPLLGLRPEFTPFRVSNSVYSFKGFGVRSGFTPFRASPLGSLLLGFRAPFIPSRFRLRVLGFCSRFSPFCGFGLGLLLASFIRVSVWVYSF